ncbi:helix-turn-helix transcriptional regulator [Actinocorallia aurea]
MTVAGQFREFLMTRRAKVQPEQVGLPRGARRKVSGLRREEVAALAGVSAEYYIQIERGHLSGVSDEVLRAIAHALLLDEAEASHLFALARADRDPAALPTRELPAPVHALLDAFTGAIAVVQNGRLDVVATGPLGRAFYSEAYEAGEPPNLARYVFLDDRSRGFYLDWDAMADVAAALLRAETGRTPRNGDLADLIDELGTASPEFRARWDKHDVRFHRTGLKRVIHPAVGPMILQYAALDVPGAPGLVLYGYTPAPGEPRTAEALRRLAAPPVPVVDLGIGLFGRGEGTGVTAG